MPTMTEQSTTKPKLIVLWSIIRSASTAFEKTFLQRADTDVIHEPFTSLNYFSRWRRYTHYGECEEMLDYGIDDIIERITSKTSPVVFVKEMAYQVLPYMNDELTELFRSAINTFIIRDPRETIVSVYKQTDYFTEDEFGFIPLEQIFNIVTEEWGQPAIVVDAHQFREDPKAVLSLYCEKIGVDFDPVMLEWTDKKLPLLPYEAVFESWWENAEKSKGIIAPPTVKPKLEIRTEHLPMVERGLKIYEKMRQFSV